MSGAKEQRQGRKGEIWKCGRLIKLLLDDMPGRVMIVAAPRPDHIGLVIERSSICDRCERLA